MEDHGFYVTLPCNASSLVYPENRISSYTTRLAKAINLKGQWEVGLAEIEYPRSWYNFNDEDGHFILHTAPEPPDSNPSNIVFSIITKLYISGGYYANIRAILRAINQLIAPAAVLNHDELKNKVYLTAKPNISVSFRGRLATILGMTLKPLGGFIKNPILPQTSSCTLLINAISTQGSTQCTFTSTSSNTKRSEILTFPF